MAQNVDFSTSNSQVTDEIINVPNSNAINLAHDLFYNKTGKLVVISTAAGGGGTVLTDTTDYTIGGAFADADLPASISPDVAYSTVAITNATYHSTNLYVAYYPIADLFRAGKWNKLTSPDEDTHDISSGNQTFSLTEAIGKPQDYTFIVRWSGGDGTYTFSFINAASNTIAGIAATQWVGQGNGMLKLQWDKANSDFKIVSPYIWDKGNFSTGIFNKFINGYAEVSYEDTTLRTCNAAAAGGYVDASARTYTFPITFSSAPHISDRHKYSATALISQMRGTAQTTTQVTLQLFAASTGGQGYNGYGAFGPWTSSADSIVIG